ncbi:LTA synthase family protein [Virgibacillus sp. L01]|uniref:LTA synthase family protein n=1 Tax=Virgibacillus sp. L01 TaxID=3457429 RepID=UPI003FD62B16
MKKMINVLVTFITVLLLILSALIFNISKYIRDDFPDQNIDEMLFYLTNGVGGTSGDVIITAIKQGLLPFLITLIIILIPIVRLSKREHILEANIRKKKFKFNIFPLKRLKLIYAFVILILSLFFSYKMLGVDSYIDRLTNYSPFIEDNYVSGTNVSIDFPKEKRNLIVLYLESMENSLINKESGGGWDYNVIPELTSLAKNNINFSNTNNIGGAFPVPGTDWTAAGLVSTTSGLPLKVPVSGNQYTSSEDFMAGAYSLGDVLREEDYNLSAMFGSDADFGGRKNFYKRHGDYKIFDVNTAIKEGKMRKEDKVWWGFDDSHLFKWAKEEITSLAGKEEPFSFTFLTANTHFVDGYLEKEAKQKFDSQYENVYAYSSKQVAEFVKWLKQQDFYKSTTLVIIGDHLSMQGGGFFPSHTYDGYERTIYNAFINSAAEPVNTKNRTFSPLDFYPTILASIGADIEGNRLGLGTNLFSDRKTLEEKFGLKYVSNELEKNSNFYNTEILQGDYIELLKEANEDK